MDVINTAINIVILVEQKRVSPHSPRMAILRKIHPIDIEWYMDGFLSNALYSVLILWFVTIATGEN